MTTDRGRSIIFYPRSYNTRGETKKHSMLGVTESGKLINVKLRLDEKHEGKENAPSIKEFAKTDYLAKNPCIASDENSSENPEGILLLSRCIKDNFDNDKGVEVYIARWAVVLSPSSQTPPLHKGLGRMEIKKDSSTVKKLSGLLRKAEIDNRLDDADSLKSQIEDPVNWSYPAIFYYPEDMITFSLDSYKNVEEKTTSILEKLAKSGIVSGLAVRARNRSNEVVKDTYREIFSKFIISETRYQNGKETFESIIKDLSEKHKNDSFKWDAIPIKKINTGPSSSRFYGKEDKLSFTRSMFTFDGNDTEPRLSKICARVSYFGDTDNTLLSRLYTLSEPLEHPARLDKAGHFSLTFTGEGTKLAHLPVEDESIVQIKDGLSENFGLINRALWLLEGNAPILRLEQEDQENNESIASTSIEDMNVEVDLEENKEKDLSIVKLSKNESRENVSEAIDDSSGNYEGDSFFELSEIETEVENIEQKQFDEKSINSEFRESSDNLEEYEKEVEDESNDKSLYVKDNDHETDTNIINKASEDDHDHGSGGILEKEEELADSEAKTENETSEENHKADDDNDKSVKTKDQKSIDKIQEKKLTGMAASLFKKK